MNNIIDFEVRHGRAQGFRSPLGDDNSGCVVHSFVEEFEHPGMHVASCGAMRIIGKPAYCAVVALLVIAGSACTSDEVATSDDELTGNASYTYYSCTTATTVGSNTWRYRVDAFNNTRNTITLIATPSGGHGEPELPNLTKLTTDTWSDNANYTVKLVQKSNGQKSIEVVDHARRHTANRANGSCNSQVICSQYRTLSNGRCVYTGEATPDSYGNFILETIAGAPAGVLVRVGNGVIGSLRAGILVARPTISAKGPSVMGASSRDEAEAVLQRQLEGLNPLSGTKAVGNGNCANEAITQAVRLLTGASVCATAYFPRQENGVFEIIADARDVLKGSKFRPETSFEQVFRDLESTLAEGQLALIISRGSKAGHATLALRLRGQLYSINNQNWPQISYFADWGPRWSRDIGEVGTHRIGTIFEGRIP
jgi:hypothetical protein